MTRVDSEEGFRKRLGEAFDLVIADYNLPGFDGLSAMEIARRRRPEWPFILVSGSLGEEHAVTALKHGATDYVLKGRLHRLPAAVRRAVAERQERERLLEAERALAEGRRVRDLVLQSLPLALYSADLDEHFTATWLTPEVSRISGFEPARFLDDPDFWASRLHPEDHERVLSEFGSLGGTREVTCSYRWQAADGNWRWFHDHAVLLPDTKPPRILGIWMDITETKRLETQFLQAQKMEAVGRLAGGVAHDFNNLLTVINGYSELLLAKMPPQAPDRPILQEIYDAGQRARSVTRQLLAFSRRQVFQPQAVDPDRLLEGLLRMLGRLVGEDIQIVHAKNPRPATFSADPGYVEQAVVNLVVNARDAMPHGGRITIETRTADLDPAAAAALPGGKPGAYVVLSVSDTGVGMSPEVKARIFEPFFTTKEKGKGTGLGLSTVQTVMGQAGGFVDVASQPGRGSTFRLYFPRTSGDAATAEPSVETAPAVGGSETVLLAEDTETIRRLVQVVLEGAGYRVLSAKDGTEALRMSEEYSGKIDLLLTDVVMTSMSGPELAQIVRRSRPETRVLFMSGYTDREIADPGQAGSGAGYLQKPFTLESLQSSVRQALDQARLGSGRPS